MLIQYRDAVQVYSESVRDLVEFIAFGNGTDQEPQRSKVRNAWDAAEKARVTLARHEGTHLCHLPRI